VTPVELEIDIRSKVPSYRQLADQIRAAVTAGEYGPDDAIPSLRQLQEETGLAQATVQHAIRVLVDEGLLVTVTGRGTFVAGR
jgi:GntR family transcriptional regulator